MNKRNTELVMETLPFIGTHKTHTGQHTEMTQTRAEIHKTRIDKHTNGLYRAKDTPDSRSHKWN